MSTALMHASIADTIRAEVETVSGRKFAHCTVAVHPSAVTRGLVFVHWCVRAADFAAMAAGIATIDMEDAPGAALVAVYPSEQFHELRDAGMFYKARVPASTLRKLRELLWSVQFDPFRLSGPAHRQTRRAVIAELTGDPVPLSQAGFERMSEALFEVFPLRFTCLADRRAKIVAAICEG